MTPTASRVFTIHSTHNTRTTDETAHQLAEHNYDTDKVSQHGPENQRATQHPKIRDMAPQLGSKNSDTRMWASQHGRELWMVTQQNPHVKVYRVKQYAKSERW